MELRNDPIKARNTTTKAMKKENGLRITRRHTKPGLSPFDQMAYEKRSARITNPDGQVVFEAKDAEVPSAWSQLASDILISKYFRRSGVPETGAETSVKQVVGRIAGAIRQAGEKSGYFTTEKSALSFEAELAFLLLDQRAAFNSPVWFNVGLHEAYGICGSGGNYFYNEKTRRPEETASAYEHPQASACFIQSVDDSLSSIFTLAQNEARIFKYGSGTGTNFSQVRGAMEKLAGGGTSSGLISFLEVLDRGAGATKSGGTTRRAAKMVSLDADHPEIEEFIHWKLKEEKKVAALIQAGYSADFNGEAYRTVAGQNSNNSVRLPDKFMRAVIEDENWETKLRTTGAVHKTLRARSLFESISQAAWACADPGVQFDTTINRWHTCPETAKIHGSNPCSEFMFIDDSACNLASVNLLKYLDNEGSFDIEGFRHACRTMFIAQDILVGYSSYPTAKIAQNSADYRPLGLGYANLGTLLMVLGIPYDSDQGRAWCGAITAIMQGEAYSTSAELAAVKGPFKGYGKNKAAMNSVMELHALAASGIPGICPPSLKAAAIGSLQRAIALGKKHGYRNAQATVLAPTGTIGLLMDCDTTGIEPDFALVKFKKLAGGGYFKIVNQSVPRALRSLGYGQKEIEKILKHIVGCMSFEHCPHINRSTLSARGLSEQDISKIEASLPRAFNLAGAFSRYNISDKTLRDIGLSEPDLSNPKFSLLETLGFTAPQIEEAEAYLCGQLTVEGCKELKPEHLPVFDCANVCGRHGKRFLSPLSHIRMMAAAQPFLSGAISKTVNLPNNATREDIEKIYLEGWKLGLKAIAVYRDGSKMSQPLSSQAEKADTEEISEDLSQASAQQIERILPKVLTRAEQLGIHPGAKRRTLPKKRQGFTVEAKVGGQKIYVRTGEFEDGGLAEIFLDMHKEGAAFRSMLNCLAIAVSKGLQHGIPLEEFVESFTFTRFEPNGVVDHENIKSATSVVDFVFRLLGMEYLGRTDFVHIMPKIAAKHTTPGVPAAPNGASEPSGAQAQASLLMGDAPACTSCGHTTVRNGACYRCLNCGTSLGCS